MKAQDIKDVLQVRDIIANADGTADLIATLIDWRDGSLGTVESVTPQQDHSAAEDAAAAAEAKAVKAPAPAKAPAKAAPAKAAGKGRAKPPPPPADDDDDGPSPDPSDDADF